MCIRDSPLSDLKIWVGGNPTGPVGEWKYMAPFSPSDVIEEYTRPARVIRDGELVAIPALSERHSVEVNERGKMEAFLTDGLRSLLNSIPCQNMSEYTVRWPGHIQKFIEYRDAGELDEFQLIQEWGYDPKIPEFTWLRVLAESGNGETMEWTVQDYGGDDGHSMARTTGLVTAICTEAWIDDSKMLPAGAHAPEVLSDRVLSRVPVREFDGTSLSLIRTHLIASGVAIRTHSASNGSSNVFSGISERSMSQVNLSGVSLKSWLHSLIFVA